VAEDSGATFIDVLGNDTDADNLSPTAPNAGLTVSAVGAASHGTTAFTANGVTYTPAPNYYGPIASRTRSSTRREHRLGDRQRDGHEHRRCAVANPTLPRWPRIAARPSSTCWVTTRLGQPESDGA
jgi:hypothetical protein